MRQDDILRIDGLTATCVYSPPAPGDGPRSFTLHVRYADCCATVKDGETKVGNVDCAIGATIEVSIGKGFGQPDAYIYRIDPLPLFEAVLAAHEAALAAQGTP